MEQRTREWYLARMGKFTGSSMKDLMGKTDIKNNNMASATAQTYISKVAGERYLKDVLESLPDEELEYHNKLNGVYVNFAMQHGIDNEALVKNMLASQGYEIAESGLVVVEDTNLGASPDGLIGEDMVLEVKCPTLQTHIQYVDKITDGASLKAVNEGYYWQVQTEMMATKRNKCMFVSYYPHLPLHKVIIEANESDQALLMQRYKIAEEQVVSIIKKLEEEVQSSALKSR